MKNILKISFAVMFAFVSITALFVSCSDDNYTEPNTFTAIIGGCVYTNRIRNK